MQRATDSFYELRSRLGFRNPSFLAVRRVWASVSRHWPFDVARKQRIGRRHKCVPICVQVQLLESRALLSSFYGLVANGHDPVVSAVSADGLTVVGSLQFPQAAAIRFTSTGMTSTAESLPVPYSGPKYYSFASSVSKDGSAITIDNYGQPYLWTKQNGDLQIPLQTSSDPNNDNLLSGTFSLPISSGGDQIAGIETSSGVFKWTVTGGTTIVIPGIGYNSLRPSSNPNAGTAALPYIDNLTGMSSDGNVIAGTISWYTDAAKTVKTTSAFRWENGSLSVFPHDVGTQNVYCKAISPDGVVFAEVDTYSQTLGSISQNVLWGPNGISNLGPAAEQFSVVAASNGGSIVVGSGAGYPGPYSAGAAIRNQDGPQSLQELLTTQYGLGPELQGWQLTEADAITPDGNTIAGVGTYQGAYQAWIVHLTPPLLPLVSLTSAATTDRKSVTADYSIAQADVTQPLAFAVYQSDHPYVDDDSIQIGTDVLFPGSSDLAQGTHEVTLVRGTQLAPTSKLPYFVVVANANNSIVEDPASVNIAFFKPPQPTVTIQRISTTDSKSLTVAYTVSGNEDSFPFTINIYRSGLDVYLNDAFVNQQILIAQAQIGEVPDACNQQADTNGSHTIVIAPNGSSMLSGYQFLQAQALRPDPSHPFVIATGDDPDNPTAPPQLHFQIFLLGAIAHGYVGEDFPSITRGLISPSKQTFVDEYATELIQDDGYASTTFGFHWESTADVPEPYQTVYAGLDLARQASQAAAKLTTNPDDVVDLNLIGWSRGSVVVTQAMTDLGLGIGTSLFAPQLLHGFMTETLVDPHPANNNVSGYSSNEESALASKSNLRIAIDEAELQGYESFQAAAVDPPIVIPSIVQEVVDIWQHTPAYDFAIDSDVIHSESTLNLWGLSPNQISSSIPVQGIDLTGEGIGHREIFLDIYQQLIISKETLSALGITPFEGDPLVVTTEPPSTATAGTSFGMIVTAENADGSVNTSFNGPITIGDYYGSLGGTLTVNAVKGVATFSGLTLDQSGTHEIYVSSPGQATVTSSYIAVTAATATQLVAIAPANVVANAAFSLTVKAEDQFGNLATPFNGNVNLAIGINPGTATLGGTLATQMVNGVASFSGLTINQLGTGFTLAASSTGLTSVSTSAFNVTDQLVITGEPPASVTAGVPFSMTIKAEDGAGNIDRSFAGSITVAATGLGGTLTVNAVAGVANFTGLTLDSSGSTTIYATSNGLPLASSNAFTVSPASATQLVVLPVSGVLAATPFSLQVEAEDQFGNVVPSFNGNVTLSLASNPSNATLAGTLTQTAANGIATFSGITINSLGTGYILKASTNGLSTGTSTPFNVTSDQLVITTQVPTTVAAGNGFGFVVSAENSSGKVDTTFNGSVTVSLVNSGSNNPTLGGTLTVTAVKGVATFSNLTVNETGTYALVVVSTGVAGIVTAPFNVNIGGTQLVIQSQPPGAVTVGATFNVAVAVENSLGELDTDFNGNVTIALGSNPGNGILGGTLTVQAVHGVASFSGLTMNSVGSGYTLQAAATGLTPTTTSALNVTAVGKATQLVIATQPPSTMTANNAFGMSVDAQDSFGAIDSTFSGTVTLSIDSNSSGGTLLGTLTTTAVNGVATFSGLTLSQVGSYSLTATATGISAATTNAISVTGAAATQLVVSSPSGSVQANSPFGLTVNAENVSGQIDPNFSGVVTLSLANNTGGSLGGVLTATAVHGVATFSGLTLNSAGGGYTIQASSSGLIAGISPFFDVTNDQLVVTTQPPSQIGAGSLFGLVVTAENGKGTVDTTFNGSVTVSPLGAFVGSDVSLAGNFTVQAINGVATFVGLSMSPSGYYALAVTGIGVGATSTNAIDVTAAAATQLQITTSPPLSVTTGAGFNVSVSALDAAGDVDTNFNGNVTLALGNDPNGGTLAGTLTATAVNGVASFSNLMLKSVATGYTLVATSSGIASATSSDFNVTAPGVVTQLAFTQSPPASITAGSSFAITVEAEDSFGIIDSSYSGSVTLNSQNDSSNGTLGGTLTATAVNGVATFSGLTLDQAADGYELTATSGTLATATSNAFNVTPATATQLVVSSLDRNVLLNSPFGVNVYAEDAYGNVDPTFNGNVSLALAANTGNATLGGTLSEIAVDGVASFSGVTISSIATNYTLQATGAGLATGTSSTFDVTNKQLVVTTQAPSVITPRSKFNFAVSAETASGNVKVAYSGSVTVSWLSFGTNSSTIIGTFTSQAVNGVATFIGLTASEPGYYMLLADGSNAGGTASNLVSVVSPITQAPLGTSVTVTSVQNVPYTFTASSFGFSDPYNSPPNGFAGVLIDTVSGGGTMADNGKTVVAGQFIPIADITGNDLVFTPALNAIGAAYADITFQVQSYGSTANGGRTLDPNPKMVTISINPVPLGIGLSDTLIPATDLGNAVVGSLTTTELGSGNTYTYTFVSGVGSSDNASFTIDSSGNLITAPGFNASAQSSYSIRIRSTDENNNSIEKVFTLTAVQAQPARTLTVDILGDTPEAGHMTLRDAINTANIDNPGDLITFARGLSGTISLTLGELPITNSMIIGGPGAAVISISGGNTSRIFDVNSPNILADQVTITGLTLTQGTGQDNNPNSPYAGEGGAIYNNQLLSLQNDVFASNFASNDGGAIEDDGTLSSSNDTFTGNSTTANGGAIRTGNSSTFISISDTFFGNRATFNGGAITNHGFMIATNDTIAGNSAGQYGGGIQNSTSQATGSLTTTNDTITWNTAGRTGGGINTSAWTSVNTIVAGNTVGGVASDISNTSSSGAISAQNTLIGDPATSGGITNGANADIVGATISRIFVTDSTGNPLLSNNGGQTQTIALGVGSPAVGAGSSLCTLSSSATAMANSLTVSNPVFLAVGDMLRIDSEFVYVSGIQGTSVTVVRGQGGTVVATHLANATVSLAYDERGVVRNGNDIGAVAVITVPTVTVPTFGNSTETAATLGGNVSSDGGGPITERGVVYALASSNANLQIGGTGVTKVTNSGTTGLFTVNATSLTPGTAYSFVAYATNSIGTTYTSPVSTFTTLTVGLPSITNVYDPYGNPVQAGSTLTSSVNALSVAFSDNMNTVSGGVNSVTNPSNWLLFRYGIDVSYEISGVTFVFNTATLQYNAIVSFSLPLYQGGYELIARQTVEDVAGRQLGGDADGTVGDYRLNFYVAQTVNGVSDVAPWLYQIEQTPLNAAAPLATPVTSSLLVYDADSNNWASATVQIAINYQSGEDVLNFSNAATPKITASWNAANGTLTLSGTDTVSDYRTALHNVKYTDTSASPHTAPTRTIYFQANDGLLPSNVITRDVTVMVSSIPAVLSGVDGSGNYFEGDPARTVAGNLLISDPNTVNLASATVSFTNWQGEDRLDFNNIFALQHTFTQDLVAHTATFTITGLDLVDHYQTLLRSVIYWDVSPYPVTSPRVASFSVTDGLSTSNVVTRNTIVTQVIQPPILASIETTPLAYKANDSAFPPLPISATLAVLTPNTNNLTQATVQVTSGYENDANGMDVLGFVNQLGITGSFNASTGTLTLSGTSSVSNYRTALRSVTFSTSGPAVSSVNRTLTIIATNDYMPAPGISLPTTRTVTVLTTNLPPGLTGISSTALSYTRGTTAVVVAPSAYILDPDSINMAGMTVQITASYQAGLDALAASNVAGITQSFNAATGTLTLTGVSSIANYQAAIRSITFKTTLAANTQTRTLTFIVNDGLAKSSAVIRNIELS